MNRVLLVCGESQGNQIILAALSRIDCTPLLASDLAAAAQLLSDESPDLVAVDLGLPSAGEAQLNEFAELCRAGSPSVPFLALLSSGEMDALDGSLQADDFIVPPYRPVEVALRIQRLIKRSRPDDAVAPLKNGELTIDLARYEVTLSGRRVDLTFKEYELLRFLAASPGKVFTRETLLNRVWGYDYFGGTRTVDVHVRRLRSKIETTTGSFIETVRNVGYRFREFRSA